MVWVFVTVIAIVAGALIVYRIARGLHRARRMGLVRAVVMDVSAVSEMLRAAETFVREYTGTPPDYTPESLERIEGVVDDLRRASGPTFELSVLLTALGCYAGEVMIRNLGGQWMSGDPRSSDPVFPDVGGLRIRVISRLFKRFYYVETYAQESLVSLYATAAQHVGERGAKAVTASESERDANPTERVE